MWPYLSDEAISVEDVRALSKDCESASTLREPGIFILAWRAERHRWCARDARPAEMRCAALPRRIRSVATVVSPLLVIGTYVLYNIRCMGIWSMLSITVG